MRVLLLAKTKAAGWLAKGKSMAPPILAVAAFLATGVAVAQQKPPKAAEKPGMGHGGMMMNGNMGDRSQMHVQMMADMKAMDATLDQKVAAMNATKGSAKVDAMAAVINEMATQRTQMMAKMSSMHEQMMGQMGERMGQPGDAAGPADAHSEHHDDQK